MRTQVTRPDTVSADRAVCSPDETSPCGLVLRATDNSELAEMTDWFIDHALAPLISALVLVLAGILLRWLAHRSIDRVVTRAEAGVLPGRLGSFGRSSAEGDHKIVSRRAQRAKSLGSLLKSVTTGIIFGVVLVMCLAEFDVNVAPILASAGVVGLALGFGAQTLVKDLLSGIAMLLEDQYGVGDVVDLGEATGTVEAVGLRITRLRDVDGTVWYVRNGEIQRVGNQSQNWARSVLDVGVRYDSDLATVRSVLQDVARDLWHDEEYSGVIIEEPEVWGVESLLPDRVVVRVTLKTAPLEQWRVAREMRERIKARFDYEGIGLFTPTMVVHDEAPPGDPAPRGVV